MQLRVIGSSPAWPNPGSAHSGYLVEAGPERLLLDCGPGVVARLRDAGATAVDAAAITHFHLDHWGDLVAWAWLRLHGSPEEPPRTELWLPPDGTAELAAFAERFGNPEMFTRAFELREYAAGRPFAAAGFELLPVSVPHYGRPAFGFRVERGGRTLGYSGDSGPSDRLAEIARGADLFLCEATLPRGELDPVPRGHLAADEAIGFADGPLLLTHRPVELPPPEGVPVARDGLVVEV